MSDRFLDNYLPYLLQRADQLLSARFHGELRRREIQPSEWRVLAVLRDYGPSSIGSLTELTLLRQPTASHAVSRLESAGRVERRAALSDGRQRIVALTSSGVQDAEQLVTIADHEFARTVDRAGIEIDARFVEQLRLLIRRVEQRT